MTVIISARKHAGDKFMQKAYVRNDITLNP